MTQIDMLAFYALLITGFAVGSLWLYFNIFYKRGKPQ